MNTNQYIKEGTKPIRTKKRGYTTRKDKATNGNWYIYRLFKNGTYITSSLDDEWGYLNN